MKISNQEAPCAGASWFLSEHVHVSVVEFQPSANNVLRPVLRQICFNGCDQQQGIQRGILGGHHRLNDNGIPPVILCAVGDWFPILRCRILGTVGASIARPLVP